MYPPLLPTLSSATTNTRKNGLMKRKWEAVKKDREWGEEGSHLVRPRPPSVHYSVVGEKRRPSSRVPVGMVFSTVVGLGSACARGLLTFSGPARLRPRPPHLHQDRVVETGVGKPIVQPMCTPRETRDWPPRRDLRRKSSPGRRARQGATISLARLIPSELSGNG